MQGSKLYQVFFMLTYLLQVLGDKPALGQQPEHLSEPRRVLEDRVGVSNDKLLKPTENITHIRCILAQI